MPRCGLGLRTHTKEIAREFRGQMVRVPPYGGTTCRRTLRRVARRGEDTKQRLLDAAERLFAERGVDGVSLREVNAAAGERNNAALYYHFHDRDGLVRAIVER